MVPAILDCHVCVKLLRDGERIATAQLFCTRKPRRTAAKCCHEPAAGDPRLVMLAGSKWSELEAMFATAVPGVAAVGGPSLNRGGGLPHAVGGPPVPRCAGSSVAQRDRAAAEAEFLRRPGVQYLAGCYGSGFRTGIGEKC
jgi:hypothetical protein